MLRQVVVKQNISREDTKTGARPSQDSQSQDLLQKAVPISSSFQGMTGRMMSEDSPVCVQFSDWFLLLS